MKIKILSVRNYISWPSWAVVYEWEDVMKEILDCELSNLHKTGKIGRTIKLYIPLLGLSGDTFKYDESGKRKIVWIMDAKSYREYLYKNCIPIFLDFPVEMVEQIYKATQELPFYWVTCFDIYSKLRKMGSQNVLFMPLSISDKYYDKERYSGKNAANKSIDVIQFGRKNLILHEYMINYCKSHPSVEYVYQTHDGSLTYYSTTRGNIGKFDSRKEYMELLSSAKVSLVSSPGMDKNRDFGNVDFFTPRFYESAVFYCHMLGRYTENQEAEMIGIKEICPNVRSEEEFEDLLSQMLKVENQSNINRYDEFLKRNVTSERVKEMKKIIESFSKFY